MPAKPQLKFGSLFSCAGCIDQLPKALGYKLSLAVEHNPESAELYAQNYGGKHLHIQSVLDPFPIPENLDWLHASPPCTLDSPARRSKPTEEEREHQNKIVMSVYNTTLVSRAKFISMENVTSFYETWAFKRLNLKMAELGYRQFYTIQRGCNGQDRRRGFMFWWKEEKDIPDLSMLPEIVNASWLEQINIRALEKDITWRMSARISREVRRALEDPKAVFPVLMERGKFSDRAMYRSADQKSFTIVSSLADDGKSGRGRSKYLMVVSKTGKVYNMHHDQLKKLQGFDKNFDLGDNPRIAVSAIGNACPPELMIKAIRGMQEELERIRIWMGK